jgi:hypothetical protein
MDLLTVITWLLIVLLMVMLWRNGRLSARLDGLAAMMKHQAEDFNQALERQASDFQEKLISTRRLSIAEIAKMRNEWIDVRQRWTNTANQFLIAKEWIRMLVSELRRHNLAVPVPPNVEELPIDRRPDESVHFPELDESREYRLDDLIAEVRNENILDDRGPLNE